MPSSLSKLLFASPVVAKDFGLLVMRLWFGLAMAFAHGMSKLDGIAGLTERLTTMEFPLPALMAWMAAITETVGGFCVAIGLLTRFWSAGLVIAMLVAAFVFHGNDPFAGKEKALTFGAGFLALLIAGGGRFSLDWALGRKSRN